MTGQIEEGCINGISARHAAGIEVICDTGIAGALVNCAGTAGEDVICGMSVICVPGGVVLADAWRTKLCTAPLLFIGREMTGLFCGVISVIATEITGAVAGVAPVGDGGSVVTGVCPVGVCGMKIR